MYPQNREYQLIWNMAREDPRLLPLRVNNKCHCNRWHLRCNVTVFFSARSLSTGLWTVL